MMSVGGGAWNVSGMASPESPKPTFENVREAINPSSSLYLTLSVGEITEVPYTDNPTHLSVTTVLHYCKCKILRPYLRLLSVMGLRPLSVEPGDPSLCLEICGWIYACQVVVLMLVGYVLQYMACFRRDRGFCYQVINFHDMPILKAAGHSMDLSNNGNVTLESEQIRYEQICHEPVLFTFIVPSALHFIAYLYAVFVLKSSDNDQLPSLMERVFLSSAHLADGFGNQKRLVRLLWTFIALSALWMLLSFVTVNFMLFDGSIQFKGTEKAPPNMIMFLKVMLIVGTLWHDMIQATVITSYSMQAQLLTSYLNFLRAKLLQYSMQPIDWMKEVSEFRKLLKYLNNELAPPVCIYTFINLCWAVSGTLWLMGFDKVDKETLPIVGISILNVVLWVILALAPFIQAARVTSACKSIQEVGHEVCIRPFVHKGTPRQDLDSLLQYASSLHMSARLFKIPITGRVLTVGLTLSAMLILVVGQCHYLNRP